MSLLILVVDDEPDVEVLFRQLFRRDLSASRFCREERIEHLFPDLVRNAGAVVTYSDLDFVAEIFCRRR